MERYPSPCCSVFSNGWLLNFVIKLGKHRSALQILAQDLNDSTSAETYSTLGGDIVPPKVAQSIADECGLQDWVTVLFGLSSGKAVNGKGALSPPSVVRLKTVNDDLKKELLRTLLEVYMDVKYDYCLFSYSSITSYSFHSDNQIVPHNY